ncbi:MAG TPA: hypothetical protein VFY12_02870 [Arenimonas sp.]|nr:hypothetical protein [Arenimonas sp.]
MSAIRFKQLLLVAAIAAALVTTVASAAGNQGRGQDKQHAGSDKRHADSSEDDQGKNGKQGKRNAKDDDKHANPDKAPPRLSTERQGVQPAMPIAPPSRDRAEHQREIGARQVAQQQAVANMQAAQSSRQAEHQAAVHQRVADKQALQQLKRDGKREDALQRQNRPRLSDNKHRANILQQQQNINTYWQNQARQQSVYTRMSQELQKQNRSNQYSYQQQYYQRLADQQAGYRNLSFNYDSDPYFYTASSYRYQRDGRYYETNQYGADLFRNAVNAGYQEGFYAGQADRRDNWRFSYRESFVYQNANFGYSGYYVRQDDYNHYFREGFQRGYDDGYYSRNTYGRRHEGSYSMLDTVLITVLALQVLR